MGFEAVKKDEKTTGSVETFTGPILREVEQVYMLIDDHGGSDEVWHKSYITCLEGVLADRGIGDALAEMIRAEGISLTDREAVSEFISANIEEVKELLNQWGYRVVDRIRFKGSK